MIRIRATGVCFNDKNELLVIEQAVNGRRYALPGGGVESGETIEAALKREFAEEVNLAIQIDRIAYISEYDRQDSVHVIEIAMIVRAVGPTVSLAQYSSEESAIRTIKFIPLVELATYLPESKMLRHIQSSPGLYTGLREA